MNLGYVMGRFPNLSETFIVREVRSLLDRGNKVTICSLKPPRSGGATFDPLGVQGHVLYAGLLSPRTLLAHFFFLFSKPSVYFGCWGRVLRLWCRPIDCLKILYVFLKSTVFAYDLRNQVDWIHSNFLHTETVSAAFVARLLNIPHGITTRVVKIRYPDWLIQEAVDQAAIVVVDTVLDKQHIPAAHNLDPNKIVLIRNGVDLRRFNFIDRSCRINRPLHILGIGRLASHKGFDVLMRASALLSDADLSFRCTIVGDGPERGELLRLREALGLSDIVDMVGAIPSSELMGYYEDADLLVVPSLVEADGTRDGLPTVVIEALATGLPVVASAAAGIPEIIAHLETGVLVPQEDPNALAEALILLIENSELRMNLGRNGRRRVEKEFDLHRSGARLEAAIASLLAGAKNPNEQEVVSL